MPATSLPLLTKTFTASGTIAQARFVTPAVAQAGAGVNTLGVASVAAVSGDKLPVVVLGTAVVEAGAAVSIGATIKTDANGKAITWATSGAKVALALSAASADGDSIEVLLIPNVA